MGKMLPELGLERPHIRVGLGKKAVENAENKIDEFQVVLCHSAARSSVGYIAIWQSASK